MHSISRKFLIGVGAISASVTLLGSVVAFFIIDDRITAAQAHQQIEYLDERVTNLSERFANLSSVHRQAAADLAATVARLTPAQVDALETRYYPRQPDGTRRSLPEDFDGHFGSEGDYVHGMGAFLSPAPSDPQERAAMAAAFNVVRHFGEGVYSNYDNFYFATRTNKLVMFAPSRPDKLIFYRKLAPATLDFRNEEMFRLISPQADPERRTRCTSLQRLLQDPRGQRLATACLTPVYLQGRFVGAFGSSMGMSDFLSSAVRSTDNTSTSLIVRAQGDILAYPGLVLGSPASDDALVKYERQYHLRDLMRRIRDTGRARGLVQSPDGRYRIAFGRLVGPDWWLLRADSTDAMRAAARSGASVVLAVGLAAALLQVLLILHIARRGIVDPLRELAQSCLAEGSGVDTTPIAARDDEIGVLARALAGERENTRLVLNSLEDRVRERTVELERANQEKSRFLANMSHELRTPLNGIVAVSELLSRRLTDAEAREQAELIVSSGRLLERVLSDILDFSKLETGAVVLAPEPFDLAELVGRVSRLHQAAAHAKGVDLEWSAAPECRRRYVGDPVRIAQVLSNLLSNAVKFTERGWVSVRVERAGTRVRFVVTDTGIGFDESQKEKLFQRFEQADPSIRRRFGGTGLGLAISRTLVELMGGEITVVSRPGSGSSFSFELPLAEAGPRNLGSAAEPDPAETSSRLSGAKVLLAEDHPTNQKIIRLIAESAGVDLTVVDNGRQALEALSAAAFDLVLMDVQMPEMDGLSALKRWRIEEELSGRARTPVIMLTANALEEDVAQSARAGADRHVAKPIRMEELMSAMETLIAERSSPLAA